MKWISVLVAVVLAGALGGCASDSKCENDERLLKNDIATATNLVFLGCLGVHPLESDPSSKTPVQDRLKLESCVAGEMEQITTGAQDKVLSGNAKPSEVGPMVFWAAIDFAITHNEFAQLSFMADPHGSIGSGRKCASDDRPFFRDAHG